MALGVPLLGYFVASYFASSCVGAMLACRRFHSTIFYNFDPSTLLSAALAKVCGVRPVVLQLEDIPVGWRSIFVRSDEVEVLRETTNGILFRVACAICDAVIMPTHRFANWLPQGKPYLVVPACNEVPLVPAGDRLADRLSFIFSGKLEAQHGIVALMDAIRLIRDAGMSDRCRFVICGRGPRTADMEAFHREIGDEEFLSFRGFVSDSEYVKLLEAADVGLALQDPAGLYGRTKTPSKAFEFISYGKVLVATDVGDLSQLSGSFVWMCRKVDAASIFHVVRSLILLSPGEIALRKRRALAYAQEFCSLESSGARMVGFIEGLRLDNII